VKQVSVKLTRFQILSEWNHCITPRVFRPTTTREQVKTAAGEESWGRLWAQIVVKGQRKI